jgi:hypothetical protein
MGNKEWERLRRIPHLGVAASVFEGVHHSRLEYVLLQCAVTGLVAKLHRNDQQLALSNNVNLSGLEAPISSGEELLKSWFLLSNFGHAQYTYGVERALLQQAFDNEAVRNWFTEDIRPLDLRRWAAEAIREYRYPEFRYILTLRRVFSLPARDRRKLRFAHYLRNLLLLPHKLFPTSPAARYKLIRLRDLFAQIRLLSMVALDAYYSHHPVSLNLNSAVLGLADLLPSAARQSGFDQLLRQTAGWLADELYLHPTAVAAQREYELRVTLRFPRRFKEARRKDRLTVLLQELMTHGVGTPRPGTLQHLVRLTFRQPMTRLLPATNHYEAAKKLTKDLVRPPHSYLSIDFNAYSKRVHLDLLVRNDAARLLHLTHVYVRLQRWLRRSLEANALANIRRLYLRKENQQRAKIRDLDRQVDRYAQTLQSIFDSVVRAMLPEGHSGVVSEFTAQPDRTFPVLVRLKLRDGSFVDTATPHLRQVLDENPDTQPPERLQELKCLHHVLRATKANLVLICPEKFVVCDQMGKRVDELDGVQIAISDKRLTLTVVEAKTGGSARNREEEAFKQLVGTRRLLVRQHNLRYRRKRIAGLGAMLEVWSEAPS